MTQTVDKTKFRLVSDELNSEGGFADRSYIDRHMAEPDDKFKARKDVAWHASYLKPACVNFTGYIFKKSIYRDIGNNELLGIFLNDANYRGDHLNLFMSSFAIDAKARGSMCVLVEMPEKIEGETLATQKQKRLVPWLVKIKPEQIESFEYTESGDFEFVEILSTYKEKTCLRGWDTEKSYIKQDGEILVDTIRLHGLGVCPVVNFTEEGDFPNTGSFYGISEISKRLLNLYSEKTEIERAQTFSILSYHVPENMASQINMKDIAHGLGTSRMLLHYGSTPAFIAPPAGPHASLASSIEALEKKIREIAMMPGDEKSGIESAEAMRERFQAKNSALSMFAARLEDFERKVWWIVCKRLGISSSAIIKYPTDFTIADVQTELATLQQYITLGFPDEVIIEKRKAIVGVDFAGVESKVMQEMIDAVELVAQEQVVNDQVVE